MERISILIVDDHYLVRQAWEKMLSFKPDYQVVYSASTAEDAIEFLKTNDPDIILLDINLPGMSGIEAIEEIVSKSPRSGIIGVSSYTLPVFVKSMMKKGAKGYITKNSPQEELFKAIELVKDGNVYVCSEIVNLLTQEFTDKIDGNWKDISGITKRELQIIQCLKRGMTSKEIAENLGLSINTAGVHRHNILKKLKLKNTAELIAFANKSLEPG